MTVASADYDVIVVGGGAAGLSADLSAREHGARVLLVEAAGKTGGSTALSGGAFLAAGTSVQRAAGYEGAAAQEKLMKIPNRLERMANYLDAKAAAERTFTFDFIYDRAIVI